MINWKCSKGMSALHFATKNGHLDVVQFLVAKGAEINGVTKEQNWTPLHQAAHDGSEKILKFLLQNNANIELPDNTCKTPLHLAMYSEKPSLVKLLLEAKANVHVQDIKNWTPMHHACFVGNLRMIQLLLEMGAKIDEKNYVNQTPYDIAVTKKHEQVVEYLKMKVPNITGTISQRSIDAQRSPQFLDCEICCEPRNGIFVFLPCGHSLSCATCCEKIKKSAPPRNICPCCRAKVQNYTKVYIQ